MERCPVCGAKVKSVNLSSHIKKVHPDAKKPDKRRRPSKKRSRTTIHAVLALLVIISLISSFFILLPPPARPQIQVSPPSHNFGTIPQVERTVTIAVSNTGEGNLRITEITTSCVCTSAVFEVGGRTSPPFSGSTPQDGWSETLLPGQQGSLEVTYDPTMFSDSGQVTRIVYIESNDPDDSTVEITIRATVTP
jgi:hypothetical protein